MKIAYCIPSLYNSGGMERILTAKINYLANLNKYELFVITTDQKGRPIKFPLDERIKLIHFDIDFERHYNDNLIRKYLHHKKNIYIYKQKLKKFIDSEKIDICISLGGKEIEFLSRLPVKCKKVAEMHFSMNFREQFLVSRHSGLIWKLLGKIRTQQLKKCTKKLDKLIVLTESDKKQWGKTHKNVKQISNFIPFNNTTVSNLEHKKVITVGRLDAQKGYDMLIDSWKYVATKHPDWELNIYGIGEWEKMLQDKINKYNLKNQVHLKGSSENIISEYVENSMYVMSSRYEGFPMVLIEAISCGLPVVSFNCEFGPNEIIKNGVDGFLVENGNIIQLAERINVLIENEKLRKEMGEKASLNAKRFSKEIIMKQWIELFESLTKNQN